MIISKIPAKTVASVAKILNKIDALHESKKISKATHDKLTTCALKDFSKYIKTRK